MSHAPMSVDLVTSSARAVLESTTSELNERKELFDKNHKQLKADFAAQNWFLRVMWSDGEDAYVRKNRTDADWRFYWEDEIKFHKRIKRALSILKLSNNTINGTVSIDSSDATFLNIEHER